MEEIAFRFLDKRGFTDANTLYCDCSCPDEVNHDDPLEDVTTMFTNRWGEVFPLGGLAGLPFTGRTGWGAFAAHVPVDGNIVLLFAPHVGIDADGNIGKVTREGQECSSTACGAAIGAFNAVKDDPSQANMLNGY